MKHIIYKKLPETAFGTLAHFDVVKRFVDDYEHDSEVIESNTHSGSIKIDLSEFDYEDLTRMHFHYSSKNNGRSIERSGLKSGIGNTSKDLDDEEAIYFSVGVEGVLHNWDVWLKWRTNLFNNPFAAGAHCVPELVREHHADIRKNQLEWVRYLKSRKYRENRLLLENVFRFEAIELSRSDYYALTIIPGRDYPKEQFDPKKAMIKYFEYAQEIYGVGISTNLDNEFAEQWNRFTELGKKTSISPDKVWLLAAEGNCDALSVLKYLYFRYIEHCRQSNTKPADFALLPKFIEYCK